MERFAFSVIGIALLVAFAMPSDRNAPTQSESSEEVAETFDEPTSDELPAYVTDEDEDDSYVTARAPQVASSSPSLAYTPSGSGRSIERGGDGQFHTTVDVNDQHLEFLIDTGADLIALTIEDAEDIGLSIDPDHFVPVGRGAGGIVKGQRVQLESVRIAGHDLGSLDAVVIDGLNQNLLGQSVLRRVARLELSGDTMIIH